MLDKFNQLEDRFTFIWIFSIRASGLNIFEDDEHFLKHSNQHPYESNGEKHVRVSGAYGENLIVSLFVPALTLI